MLARVGRSVLRPFGQYGGLRSACGVPQSPWWKKESTELLSKLSELPKAMPETITSLEELKKQVQQIGAVSIPNWYTEQQRHFLSEWDNLIRSITWREEDFLAKDLVTTHPMLILAKSLVEFGNLTKITKTTSHLLPVTVGLFTLMRRQNAVVDLCLPATGLIEDARHSYWLYHHAHLAEAPYRSKSRDYLLQNTLLRPESILICQPKIGRAHV